MYHFYILECGDGSLYSGIAKDVKQRLRQHNAGKGSKYVRAHGGGRVVYAEECGSLGDALRRENQVKKLSRQDKLSLIKNNTMANKTILISGGVTGIGAATALEFLENNWNVSVFSNVKEHNEEFFKLAESQGLSAGLLVLEADITKEKDLKKAVAQTKKRFKTIDVLFNNAGMGYFTEADKVDVKKFDQMMEVNVIGMAGLTKQVIPIMKKQKGGQIINNASIAGKVGHAKSEFYAATKSAVMRYSEGLRAEIQSYGIKVAVIYTSTVKTGFWSKKEYSRRKKENWKGKDPVFLTTQDLARTVQFIVGQPGHSSVEEITIMPFGK